MANAMATLRAHMGASLLERTMLPRGGKMSELPAHRRSRPGPNRRLPRREPQRAERRTERVEHRRPLGEAAHVDPSLAGGYPLRDERRMAPHPYSAAAHQ